MRRRFRCGRDLASKFREDSGTISEAQLLAPEEGSERGFRGAAVEAAAFQFIDPIPLASDPHVRTGDMLLNQGKLFNEMGAVHKPLYFRLTGCQCPRPYICCGHAVDSAVQNESRTSSPGRSRVLVVDDNRDSADMIVIMCGLKELDAQAAYSARHALQLHESFNPNFILCDIGLPDMSGYELARTIRADRSIRRCSLIAVSGFGRPQDKQSAVQAGFDAHLTKPFEFDDLFALISATRERDLQY